MAALALYRADLHSCGHPLSETTAPDAEGRYKVGPPYRCHACTALELAQKAHGEAVKKAGGNPSDALIWQAQRP